MAGIGQINNRESAMTAPSTLQVTKLLQAWGQGKDAALDQLLPVVHQELRRLARRYMFGERPGHTLQTTALVNEAYLRLVNSRRVNWQNRAHFFAISAQLMRRILVDSARARRGAQPDDVRRERQRRCTARRRQTLAGQRG